MYKYSEKDTQFLIERVDQFEKQLNRHLSGELDEDKFRSLRLRNGLYMELHAHMLRIAIPYGILSSDQLRACLLYTSPSPRDLSTSRMPSSA